MSDNFDILAFIDSIGSTPTPAPSEKPPVDAKPPVEVSVTLSRKRIDMKAIDKLVREASQKLNDETETKKFQESLRCDNIVSKTLNDRLNDHARHPDLWLTLREYSKSDGKRNYEKTKTPFEDANGIIHENPPNTTKVTGKALLLNHADEQLTVIDIDINRKDLENIRNEILEMLPPHFVIVRTGSGGLHVLCNRGDFEMKETEKNRLLKAIVCDKYEIDVFFSNSVDKRSLIVWEGSRTEFKFYDRDEDKEKRMITENDPVRGVYAFIRGGYDSVINYTFKDVLEALQIKAEDVDFKDPELTDRVRKFLNPESHGDVPVSVPVGVPPRRTSKRKPLATSQSSLKNELAENVPHIPEECPEDDNVEAVEVLDLGDGETMTLDDAEIEHISTPFYEALIKGFDEEIEIHNDTGNVKLEDEVTLFPLMTAINALPKGYRSRMYKQVLENCKFTEKAREKFEYQKKRNAGKIGSVFTLVKILKLYKEKYYINNIRPLLYIHKREGFQAIDFKDDFLICDMMMESLKGRYNDNEKLLLRDLSRVIRVMHQDEDIYIVKSLDTKSERGVKRFTFRFCKAYQVMKMLKPIPNAFETLVKYTAFFFIDFVRFFDRTFNCVNYFHGYVYERIRKCNLEVINPFLNFVKEVIADNNVELYEYILNWFAYIVQNPGLKTGTALVLQGIQGTGKTTFTDVLSEMLRGYSEPNITNIEHITGKFNRTIENKMLIVLNEVKNAGNERFANFDCLKSIITERYIQIEEKNQPARTAENVANLIFCTNHSMPIKIEASDRRYVVTRCNSKYSGHNTLERKTYWRNLHATIKGDDFYRHLITFFLDRNISEFDPRDIPITEAKESLVEAFRSPFEEWLCENHDKLVEGMLSTELEDGLRSLNTNIKTTYANLKMYCSKHQKRIDGTRKWVWKFNDERVASLFPQTKRDEDVDVNEMI